MRSMEIARSELLREEVSTTRLDCGLEVCVQRKAGYAKKYALIGTRYGSLDTKFRRIDTGETVDVPDGLAHFLEHKLFAEESGSIDDVFAELGAYSNAFTDYTMTAYLFSCVDNFGPCLDTLLDFVMRPHFTEENVENEKGIIEQEIKRDEDSPAWQAMYGMLKGMYQCFPVRLEVAGTVDSIRSIDVDILTRCYNTFYHPSNMTLLVVGDVDPNEVADRASAHLDDKLHGPVPAVERLYPHEPREVGMKRVERRMPVSEPLVCFGFKDNDVGYEGAQLLRKTVCMEMLLYTLIGRSSALYNELYEAGLLDHTFDWNFDCEKDYSFVIFEGKSNSPDALVDRVCKGINDSIAAGIDRELFERARRSFIGSALRAFNSLEFIAYNFLAYHFRKMRLLDRVGVAESISLDEVMDLGKQLFDPEMLVVSVVNPMQ
ncbi:MAG TPA: insulinase family protein [Firmicutes bacterium]|nr:insulinase family protein [Bacillota bacterium]